MCAVQFPPVETQGLIQQLEAALGQPLSQAGRQVLEAGLLGVYQAAVNFTTQTLFAAALANVRLLGATSLEPIQAKVGESGSTAEAPSDG